jgi:hypothetical protein
MKRQRRARLWLGWEPSSGSEVGSAAARASFAFHARTIPAATSGGHFGCRADTNHAGSALVVVAVLVVIVLRTVHVMAHGDGLGRTEGLRRYGA